MKIISIQILAVEPARSAIPAVPVAAALNLSSFSFYQRSVISQFMDFFSRTVAERTAPGQRQSVEQESASTAYTAHAYTRASDNLAGVIITDQEYPVRVAFSLINKILDEFTTQVKRDVWEAKARDSRQAGKQYLVEFPQLQEYCTKYQDPKQADTIMKVQQELDETKIILVRSVALARKERRNLTTPDSIPHTLQHKTIESVLERGEKLDSLVDKSAALSASSKNFYKTAQKQNSCCVVM